MRLIWDELTLALDSLMEMRFRGTDQERRAAGALGVKVIGELQTLWPAICSGEERNQTGAEMELTREEMRIAIDALAKARKGEADPDRMEAIGALALKLFRELRDEDNQGGEQ